MCDHRATYRIYLRCGPLHSIVCMYYCYHCRHRQINKSIPTAQQRPDTWSIAAYTTESILRGVWFFVQPTISFSLTVLINSIARKLFVFQLVETKFSLQITSKLYKSFFFCLLCDIYQSVQFEIDCFRRSCIWFCDRVNRFVFHSTFYRFWKYQRSHKSTSIEKN